MQLRDIAKYVRSKNAGPFWVPIDIFCETQEAFEALTRSVSLTADSIGQLYGVEPEKVKIFHQAHIRVIKVSIPRPVVSGDFHDRDIHAGQYFVPMLALTIEPHNSAA